MYRFACIQFDCSQTLASTRTHSTYRHAKCRSMPRTTWLDRSKPKGTYAHTKRCIRLIKCEFVTRLIVSGSMSSYLEWVLMPLNSKRFWMSIWKVAFLFVYAYYGSTFQRPSARSLSGWLFPTLIDAKSWRILIKITYLLLPINEYMITQLYKVS